MRSRLATRIRPTIQTAVEAMIATPKAVGEKSSSEIALREDGVDREQDDDLQRIGEQRDDEQQRRLDVT